MNDYFDEISKLTTSIKKEINFELCISLFNKDPYNFLSLYYMVFCNNFYFGLNNNNYCSKYPKHPIPFYCNNCKKYKIYEHSYGPIPTLHILFNSKLITNCGILL